MIEHPKAKAGLLWLPSGQEGFLEAGPYGSYMGSTGGHVSAWHSPSSVTRVYLAGCSWAVHGQAAPERGTGTVVELDDRRYFYNHLPVSDFLGVMAEAWAQRGSKP